MYSTLRTLAAFNLMKSRLQNVPSNSSLSFERFWRSKSYTYTFDMLDPMVKEQAIDLALFCLHCQNALLMMLYQQSKSPAHTWPTPSYTCDDGVGSTLSIRRVGSAPLSYLVLSKLLQDLPSADQALFEGEVADGGFVVWSRQTEESRPPSTRLFKGKLELHHSDDSTKASEAGDSTGIRLPEDNHLHSS